MGLPYATHPCPPPHVPSLLLGFVLIEGRLAKPADAGLDAAGGVSPIDVPRHGAVRQHLGTARPLCVPQPWRGGGKARSMAGSCHPQHQDVTAGGSQPSAAPRCPYRTLDHGITGAKRGCQWHRALCRQLRSRQHVLQHIGTCWGWDAVSHNGTAQAVPPQPHVGPYLHNHAAAATSVRAAEPEQHWSAGGCPPAPAPAPASPPQRHPARGTGTAGTAGTGG